MKRNRNPRPLLRLELALPPDVALALIMLARKSGVEVDDLIIDLLRDVLGTPAAVFSIVNSEEGKAA